MSKFYRYPIINVDKVTDGDTVKLTLDLGFNLYKKLPIRLMGYDAPEIFFPTNENEYKAGIKVKEYLESLVDKFSYIETFKDPEIYGRFSGIIYTDYDQSINEMVKEYMIRNGLTKEAILKEG